MDNSSLDLFGKGFIERVRDNTIEMYLKSKLGLMKGENAEKLKEVFASFSEDDKNKIDIIVFDVVETLLHQILFMFESTDYWSIVDKGEAEDSGIDDLANVSDGLSGELFSEGGWIEKYSKYKERQFD